MSSPQHVSRDGSRVSGPGTGARVRGKVQGDQNIKLKLSWNKISIQGELEAETGWRAVPDNTLETLAEQFRYFGEHKINRITSWNFSRPFLQRYFSAS